MNIFLLFLTLMMTWLLLFLLKKPFKDIYKKAIKIYAVLFGISSITIGGILINTYKADLYQLFKNNSQDAYAVTSEFPKIELEPVFPLIDQFQLRPEVQLEAPGIRQHPELARGCEVTSLAMLLQFHDVDVDKMQLAKEVSKDKTPHQKTDDGVYFGNPSKGFVGDIYTYSKPGFGVYHEPIAELARKYLGDRVEDFTGGSFYEIINHVNQDRPVWVITNTSFKELSDDYFETWQTDDGPIEITMKEHSVLVVGYDKDYIFFNDPTYGEIRKAPIENFKEAWVQMGKQAITVHTP